MRKELQYLRWQQQEMLHTLDDVRGQQLMVSAADGQVGSPMTSL